VPERVNKLQPDRTLQLRGFNTLVAATSIANASSTGFTVSGTFHDHWIDWATHDCIRSDVSSTTAQVNLWTIMGFGMSIRHARGCLASHDLSQLNRTPNPCQATNTPPEWIGTPAQPGERRPPRQLISERT
jgi:hypothetical protein